LRDNIIRKKAEEEIKANELNEVDFGLDFRDGITSKDVERERDIYVRDQLRIDKKYNSKRKPILKLTAEYLKQKWIRGEVKLDKKIICKDMKIKMGVLNKYLSELNRYEKFQPMRWISSADKKDFIELAGIDFRNSYKWLGRNLKGSISRTSRIYQTKQKVKLEEENKIVEEIKKKQRVKLITR